MINAESGPHELANEAALHERQAPGPGPLSPATCSSAPAQSAWGAVPGELVARDIAVFITGHALITAGNGCRAQVMLTGGPGLGWR